MNFMRYFTSQKKGSAKVAKERLQIIVAHERTQRDGPEYLPMLREELLEVVRKYVQVDQEAIRMELEREGDYEVLELNIMLPESPARHQARAR
ncbi:cell division topological specificity factor MinE [Alkalilimnicola ehrlichii]|uniref:Cell division topological specificity factor n=1 Tax=Alkalilimnicola ehrlichii TaxID=351052 RepID=A0A3E0X067_9GAMM|nr:cell division topological specificity factor MinE [Alkalilimnicola ehrlichii]RFA30861.1 cell division topological specificity factor MinE [Alkalilimnicola ehrlichii]RFA38812.1 cell division topological specificity factor MinE [Alkalilimnicola ehrlichii]